MQVRHTVVKMSDHGPKAPQRLGWDGDAELGGMSRSRKVRMKSDRQADLAASSAARNDRIIEKLNVNLGFQKSGVKS